MIYPDIIQMIEQDRLAVLQTDAFISKRPIVMLEPGDIASVQEQKITKAYGLGQDGKLGVGFGLPPIERVQWPDPNVADAALKLPLSIYIWENITQNLGPKGTKYSLRQWALYTAKLLSRYSAQNLTTDWVPEKNVIVFFTPIINDKIDENLRGCRIDFSTYESDPISFATVSNPMLTPDHELGGAYPYLVNVAAADSDDVYWTIDGSHPWSGNNAATKWDGQLIKISQPSFLRVRGFAANKTGSPTSSIFFT